MRVVVLAVLVVVLVWQQPLCCGAESPFCGQAQETPPQDWQPWVHSADMLYSSTEPTFSAMMVGGMLPGLFFCSR